MKLKLPLAAAGLGVAVLLGGCGSSSTTASSAATTAATTTAKSGTATSTAAGTTTAQKVNANTASVSELTAALTAAGVSNPSKWAREVEEYRPYPTDDPTFASLRKELAKYNPSDETVNQIISALTL